MQNLDARRSRVDFVVLVLLVYFCFQFPELNLMFEEKFIFLFALILLNTNFAKQFSFIIDFHLYFT